MDKQMLEYFRKILEEMLKKTQDEISGSEKIDAEDTRLPDDTDLASAQYEQSFNIRMKERNETFLKKIKKTIKAIDEGTYGVCDECGNDIEIERLKARPVATVCIECKREMEKEEKNVN